MSALWIQGSSGLKMPETAVVLGKGENHSSIYVGSVLHEGKRVLAQVHPSKKAAYFHRQGQDVEMLYYKILCAPNTNWSKYTDKIPSNALLVSLGTETVYIGRSQVSPNKIYIGTIQANEGMSVDFYGESAKLSDCEILVSGDAEEPEMTNMSNIAEKEISDAIESNTVQSDPTSVPMAVFNYHTEDLPTPDDVETDSGLIEYEELEERTMTEEYGTSLELIEENDENV